MKMSLAALLSLAFVGVSGLSACSTIDPDNKPDVPYAERDEGIMITGSRIPRRNKNANVGVTVMDADGLNTLRTTGNMGRAAGSPGAGR